MSRTEPGPKPPAKAARPSLAERLGWSAEFDRSAAETRAKVAERCILFTAVAGLLTAAVGWRMAALWWVSNLAIEGLLWVLTPPDRPARGVRGWRLLASLCAASCWAWAGFMQWTSGDLPNQLAATALMAGILLYSVRACHRFPLLFLACATPPIAVLVSFAFSFHAEPLALLQVSAAAGLLGLFAFTSAAAAFRSHQAMKQTADALAAQQATAELTMGQLKTLVDTLPEGVVLLDAEGRYITWNRRYAEIYQRSADLLEAGRPLMDALRTGVARGDYPEAVGREEAWLAERAEQLGREGERHEQQLADGTWLLVEDRRTPDGGIVGLRIDITAMKRQADEVALATEEREAVIGRLEDGLARLAEGDLTCTLAAPFPETYERLRVNFNATLESLRAAFGDISELAGHVGASAATISGASDDLSRRTERQAATLQETSAGLGQATDSVVRAAADAGRVREAAGEAFDLARGSREVVDGAVHAMDAIKSASARVEGVCATIEALATQTRMLALNAGIEAQRAGPAGRGFAVIAQEVRALAENSARAAQEIRALASASVKNVGDGAALVERAGEAFIAISARVSAINELVVAMARAADDQALGLQEVNQAMAGLDDVTQQNAAMVEETTQSAHALAQEAARLSTRMRRFRLGQATAEAVPEPLRRSA